MKEKLSERLNEKITEVRIQALKLLLHDLLDELRKSGFSLKDFFEALATVCFERAVQDEVVRNIEDAASALPETKQSSSSCQLVDDCLTDSPTER
jgi:hypothetical protein